MRMNSFLIFNLPISYGFVLASPTPFNTIFWQWINQTYNAMLNYGNRNTSSAYSNTDVMLSYFLATGSSVFVALKIRSYLKKYTDKMSGSKLIVFNSFSAFAACALSNFINTVIIRSSEYRHGIEIYARDGTPCGKSRNCARKAILETALSRVVLTLPIFGPPFILFLLEKMRLLPKNPYALFYF